MLEQFLEIKNSEWKPRACAFCKHIFVGLCKAEIIIAEIYTLKKFCIMTWMKKPLPNRKLGTFLGNITFNTFK